MSSSKRCLMRRLSSRATFQRAAGSVFARGSLKKLYRDGMSAADVYAVEAPLALASVASIVPEVDRPDLGETSPHSPAAEWQRRIGKIPVAPAS